MLGGVRSPGEEEEMARGRRTDIIPGYRGVRCEGRDSRTFRVYFKHAHHRALPSSKQATVVCGWRLPVQELKGKGLPVWLTAEPQHPKNSAQHRTGTETCGMN